MNISLREDEIQVLIAVAELRQPRETPHNTHYTCYPTSMAEAAAYFHQNLVPWDSAYRTLHEKDLLLDGDTGYNLTSEGMKLANRLRHERPPIYYWYRTLYQAIPSSPAFAKFCEEVYGVNWNQHGFCDLQQIHFLLNTLALQANQRVLDIGCGTGRFAEYLSDQFGVLTTGIDYCDAAVQLARERTAAKRHCLTFETQNIDHITFPPHSFDVIISIDSLGFVADMEHTIAELYTLLKPQGQLAIFWFAITDTSGTDAAILKPDGTPVARACAAHELAYTVHDVSEENWRILQLRHATALRYKDAFMAEGHQFLFENLLRESEPGTIPFCEDTCHIRRFLYMVKNESLTA